MIDRWIEEDKQHEAEFERLRTDNARLMDEVERLRAALEMVEWIDTGGKYEECPWCRCHFGYDADHATDCPRQLALGK